MCMCCLLHKTLKTFLPINCSSQVANIRSDALFILLVEKDAAFMRLAEDRFYNTYPCIIVTAKGQPDVATRLFLKKLKQTLNIPVLALVDSDPYGLKILSVYMKGIGFVGNGRTSGLITLTLCTTHHDCPCRLHEHVVRQQQPHHTRHQVARGAS